MRAAISRDSLEIFHDCGCLVKERIVYFGSEYYDDSGGETGVDFASAGKLIKNLLYLDSQSEELITLHFNSPGGDWHRGISIYDCLLGLRSPVRIIGYGEVSSMGSIIIQAGIERLLTPNCRFMIHMGIAAFYGHTEDYHRDAKESERICNIMYNIYYERMVVKNPKITLQKIKKLCEHDFYMSGQEAVDLGLADKVLGTVLF